MDGVGEERNLGGPFALSLLYWIYCIYYIVILYLVSRRLWSSDCEGEMSTEHHSGQAKNSFIRHSVCYDCEGGMDGWDGGSVGEEKCRRSLPRGYQYLQFVQFPDVLKRKTSKLSEGIGAVLDNTRPLDRSPNPVARSSKSGHYRQTTKERLRWCPSTVLLPITTNIG